MWTAEKYSGVRICASMARFKMSGIVMTIKIAHLLKEVIFKKEKYSLSLVEKSQGRE